MSASAIRTIAASITGLTSLGHRFDDPSFAAGFEWLTSTIHALQGRVIVTGIGKSGIVARKIAATLTSTGTPSVFLHPSEAAHGDLGIVTENDLVLMLTNSGESVELAPILTYCRRFGVRVAAITSQTHSTVGTAADVHLVLPDIEEACPIALSPTTSTTLQMVLGDAIAMAMIELRGFSSDDFRNFHPGGRLGMKFLKVADLMATDTHIPRVRAGGTLLDATMEMTRARVGSTAIVNDDGRLVGVFTDGDLRRTVTRAGMGARVDEWMTRQPRTIGSDRLASDALREMRDHSILALFVVDEGKLSGVLHLHDLLRIGVA